MRYLVSVSAAQIPLGAVTAAAAEMWTNIDRTAASSSSSAGGLRPCSAVDLEALMTIPF